jgi:hypothetical protein
MVFPSLETSCRKPSPAGFRLITGGVAVKQNGRNVARLLCIAATLGRIQLSLTMSGVDPVTKGE